MRRRAFWRGALAVSAVLAIAMSLRAAVVAGDRLVVQRAVSRPEAIVALGSHEWERLPALANAAKRAPSAAVLLTQPIRPTPHNCHLCPTRVAWLAQLGVPAARVTVLPRTVGNTYDEAVASFEYARTHAVTQMLVVTSPYHARRALATFEHVFEGSGRIVGIEPAVRYSPARPRHWWMHGYDRAYVRYEWSALAWYALRYGVVPGAASLAEANRT